MAKRFTHVADLAGGVRVPYSPKPRPGRGKWSVVFNDPQGRRRQLSTVHEIRGKHPPLEFHEDATRLIRGVYSPEAPDPAIGRRGWDDLLDEVARTSPHARPETLRSYRAGAKAVREILPEVASPLDVTDDRVRRFSKLWLAAPSKAGRGGGRRSPVTLSYYLRGLSAFTNHLVQLGHVATNPWHGVKAPKGERTRKPVPTEGDTTEFFDWVHARYPGWAALHALLELKCVSACRTADVCQLRTAQLRGGKLTFGADQTKTKESRSLPLPPGLFAALSGVAGPVHLWENLFRQIPAYRKASNGYPDAFSWRTVYYVVNNLFREYSDAHPGRPRFTPHALRRRAITLTVAATGSVDAAASAIGVHPQTARSYYLDAKRAFDTDDVMRKVAEALRPKLTGPKGDQSTESAPQIG